ncbi:Bromodomain and PHD finger-containing protein 3 [Gracilariopsis chorda]|uniref:Bromodomain and PHD finger-containing protein 3 n=1 Tax=Gracilariopsis chorda TaxID=448386 RepID=A0A2V3IZV9_9FLOR|nr:Bromodomain and PHD finger-containing protein 3 [Gracilariopsis chorda]|eukprot:PXF47217.1 Bromodomain and PHD finger-containing protein 3 [Gracilariopsis chorda]
MAPSRQPRAPTCVLRDPKDLLKKGSNNLLKNFSDRDGYYIFLQPVDFIDIDSYAELFVHPPDLSVCHRNLAMGVYRTLMNLRADRDLMWCNCCTFNADDSIYFKGAMCSRQFAICLALVDRLLSQSARRFPVKLTHAGNS